MLTFKNKKQKILIFAAITLISGLNFGAAINVVAISKACQKSDACMAAVAKEKEANKNAASAAKSANAYQIKVSELSAEIAKKEAEIANTTAEVEELKDKIEEKEAKLDEEREALAELLVKMHFESDAEPIRILAGASSISDLAEKAAREEVAQEQINAKAESVKKVKEELEGEKAKVEELLAKQETEKADLSKQQSDKKALVEKYENDAEAYNAVAAAAQEEARKAAQKYQEDHPEEFMGTASQYTGVNTYPWQGDCPGRQDEYTTYWDGYVIGGYVCECVSYAGWKAYETFGIAAAWGHAYSWAAGAANDGYTVNNTPAANTIGQSGGAPYGHVFWVENVNGDGSIDVTEYNNAYATQLYSGSFHYGDFGSRTIPANEVGQYNYIHFN